MKSFIKKASQKKATIGIAMAAIMAASVFVAMAPTVSARPPGQPKNIESGDTVYIGEQGLNFDLNDDGTYGDSGTLQGVPDTPTEGASPITVSADMTIPERTEGKYYYDTNGDGEWTNGTVDFYVFIDHAEISGDVILNTEEQDSVDGKSVPTNTEIVFKVEPNIGTEIPGGCVDIKVYDPDGVQVTSIDGQDLTNIGILGTTMFVGNPAPTTTTPEYADALDLTNLDTGEYTVKFELDKTSCNMLDVSSPEYTFTIRSEELSIEAVEDVVGKGEDMGVTVKGTPNTYYYLIVTDVNTEEPPEIKDMGDVEARDNVIGDAAGDASTVPNLAAWIQTESDGIGDVKIATTGADERSYKIKVYDTTAVLNPDQAGGPTYDTDENVDDATAEENEESVDIEVEEAEVTFDIPASVIIGKELTIKGAINAGDYVDIVIEDADEVFDDEPVDENNEFEVDWETEGLTTGSYTIDVYIDRADVGGLNTEVPDVDGSGDVSPPDYEDIDEDGKTSIRLVVPGLTAKQVRNVVAEDDDYIAEGTATGVDDVDVVLVGPNGYPPDDPGLDVENGLDIMAVSVTDNEFSEDITMGGVGFDTGMWKALVLSPGRDSTYEDLVDGRGNPVEAGNLDTIPTGWLAGKNQDQIIAMILDRTKEAAGSDDLVEALSFKVESGRVELNPIESVAVGEPLNISGTTNREPGTPITISTFAGPMDLPAAIVEVEWPTPDQAVFNATIDTTDADVGTYTLEADDGDGHTDTATVNILTAAPTPTPSPTPTATPTPSPSPSPSPVASPTPTPSPSPSPSPTPKPPGFTAVFAISGLLAVAYLVLRKRRK